MNHMDVRIDDLMARRQVALAGGGADRVAKHHAKGRYTARERLELLLDEGSFDEIDMLKEHRCTNFGMSEQQFPGDGVVTGYGTIDGRLTYVYAFDATVFGGSLSETVAEKVCKVMDLAVKNGAPIIGLNDSGGARIQEGIESLAGYTDIFLRNVMVSGVVPQLSGVFGPCAGGAVYSPALTDFTVMVEGSSYMFLTGPAVVKSVTHEDVDAETLGGAAVHTTRSGVAHLSAPTEEEAIDQLKRLLSFMPSKQPGPAAAPADRPIPPDRSVPYLNQVIPEDPNHPYDMKEVIVNTVDDGDFLEIQPGWAPNLVVGFGRYAGMPAASSRTSRSTWPACSTTTRPSRVPASSGSATASTSRWSRSWTCRASCRVPCRSTAASSATAQSCSTRTPRPRCPKVTITTRKAYGGAYCVMSSKHLRGDINYAWPTAEIAVMGARGAVGILYAREIKAAGENAAAVAAEKEAEYAARFANPYEAAKRGYIDSVIRPAQTRLRVCKSLRMLENKQDSLLPKKHGNIPL
jgi:methylmalonyl-CoA decarboxylase subunit alpha